MQWVHFNPKIPDVKAPIDSNLPSGQHWSLESHGGGKGMQSHCDSVQKKALLFCTSSSSPCVSSKGLCTFPDCAASTSWYFRASWYFFFMRVIYCTWELYYFSMSCPASWDIDALSCSFSDLSGLQQFNCMSSAIDKVIHLHLHLLHPHTPTIAFGK